MATTVILRMTIFTFPTTGLFIPSKVDDVAGHRKRRGDSLGGMVLLVELFLMLHNETNMLLFPSLWRKCWETARLELATLGAEVPRSTN